MSYFECLSRASVYCSYLREPKQPKFSLSAQTRTRISSPANARASLRSKRASQACPETNEGLSYKEENSAHAVICLLTVVSLSRRRVVRQRQWYSCF